MIDIFLRVVVSCDALFCVEIRRDSRSIERDAEAVIEHLADRGIVLVGRDLEQTHCSDLIEPARCRRLIRELCVLLLQRTERIECGDVLVAVDAETVELNVGDPVLTHEHIVRGDQREILVERCQDDRAHLLDAVRLHDGEIAVAFNLILPDIEIHCDHEARCERRRDADIGEFTGIERLDIVILCEHIQDVFGLDIHHVAVEFADVGCLGFPFGTDSIRIGSAVICIDIIGVERDGICDDYNIVQVDIIGSDGDIAERRIDHAGEADVIAVNVNIAELRINDGIIEIAVVAADGDIGIRTDRCVHIEIAAEAGFAHDIIGRVQIDIVVADIQCTGFRRTLEIPAADLSADIRHIHCCIFRSGAVDIRLFAGHDRTVCGDAAVHAEMLCIDRQCAG